METGQKWKGGLGQLDKQTVLLGNRVGGQKRETKRRRIHQEIRRPLSEFFFNSHEFLMFCTLVNTKTFQNPDCLRKMDFSNDT